jgi:hypothetical protein
MDGLGPVGDAEVRAEFKANRIKLPCSIQQRIFFISTDRKVSKNFASLGRLDLILAPI